MSDWKEPAPGPLRWRQRRWWGWLTHRFYAWGVISGSVSSGHKDGWIVHSLRWRGARPYVLGIERHRWGGLWHFVRAHHWPLYVWGPLCGKCAPWPCCGATGHDHADGCADG